MEHVVKREPTAGVYLAVWAGLLALTALTVSLAGLGLGKLGILVVLAIAGAKSAFIAAYYMHLRYERVRLYVGFVLIAVLTLAIFTGLTLLEVAGR